MIPCNFCVAIRFYSIVLTKGNNHIKRMHDYIFIYSLGITLVKTTIMDN